MRLNKMTVYTKLEANFYNLQIDKFSETITVHINRSKYFITISKKENKNNANTAYWFRK